MQAKISQTDKRKISYFIDGGEAGYLRYKNPNDPSGNRNIEIGRAMANKLPFYTRGGSGLEARLFTVSKGRS